MSNQIKVGQERFFNPNWGQKAILLRRLKKANETISTLFAVILGMILGMLLALLAL